MDRPYPTAEPPVQNRKADSPKCPACWSNSETVHLYLLRFPAYVTQRRQLEEDLGRAARLISMLLMNPKAFPYLFRYIHNTWHFHSTFGDLQSS